MYGRNDQFKEKEEIKRSTLKIPQMAVIRAFGLRDYCNAVKEYQIIFASINWIIFLFTMFTNAPHMCVYQPKLMKPMTRQRRDPRSAWRALFQNNVSAFFCAFFLKEFFLQKTANSHENNATIATTTG